MNLLVSTSCGVVRFKDSPRSLYSVLPQSRETYGISWTPNGEHLLVACTSGRGHALSFDDLAGYARSEVGTVVCNGAHSPECLSAPHQLHCVDNTYVLVANSGRNAIAKMRLDDWCMSLHRVDTVYWDRFDPTGMPGLHLNSVYHNHNTVYAVAHNFQRGSRVYALSWPQLEVRNTWHYAVGGMHNVSVLDNRLLTCDSLNGCLVDALTGETVWSNGGTGMTRGLAASQNRIYVGSSAFASRETRANTSGGIWVLDRSTFSPLEYIVLSELGGVNEVRIADGGDACHHGEALVHVPQGSPLPTPDVLPPDALIDSATQDLHRHGWRVVSGSLPPAGDCSHQVFEAATDSGLVVVQASAHCQPELAAHVRFQDGVQGTHASLVLEYEGPGDTSMVAGMLRRTPQGLLACIWRHSGRWDCLASHVVPESTAASLAEYRVEFARTAEQYVLQVAGAPTLKAAASGPPPQPSGSVGVRLSGPGVSISDIRCLTRHPPQNPH